MTYTPRALQTLQSRFLSLFNFLFNQEKPNVISPDDRKRLEVANMLAVQPRMALYQEMIDRYSDSQPSLLLKLADLYVSLNADTLAIALYRKVRCCCCLASCHLDS